MTFYTKTTTFNFPYPVLTKIEGEPTNSTITILKREIYANAMENMCTIGCGKLGYLGLIMPDANFEAKQKLVTPDGPFKPFTKPGQTPDDDDSTDDDSTVQKYNAQILRDYVAMETTLKQQLLGAIKRTYLTAIEDAEVGFALVPAKEILAYVIAEYGTVTLDDLHANTEVLNEPWNNELPIRMLWDRIKECQRVSEAGGEQLTDRMAMFTALRLLDATGVFSVYTTSWRQSYPIQTAWSMKTFRDYFNTADKDRKKNMTVKDVGLHGANAAVKATYASITDSTKKETTTQSEEGFKDPTTNKVVYYCWSHGGNLNPQHTSAKCKYPKEGHVKEATWFNMHAGCSDMKFGKNRIHRTGTAATTTD